MKKIIDRFINNNKDAPLLAALICGLTPMLFYYSNNYWAANSFSHLLFFSVSLIGSSFLVFLTLFYGFKRNSRLSTYLKYLIYVLLLGFLYLFLIYSFFSSIKIRIALFMVFLVLGFILKSNPRKNYKKLIIVLCVFSSLSLGRIFVHIYEDVKPDYWLQQNDTILDIKFKSFPNIYLIQPDGYVAKSTLEKSPYNFKSDLYDWLNDNGFKVYDNFRSNYPASLTSNASLFGMKQHKFANMIFPDIEMANAREAITTSNPAVSILNNNGYSTHFIAQDEYFQQNRKQENFDYFNIQKADFPFYTDGGCEIKDVFADLKLVMNNGNENPKFFFIEKLLPHHVGFPRVDDVVEIERKKYNNKINEVNIWLKKVVNYISDKDVNAIIIILADHGGWVGLKSFNDLFSNTDPELVNSTFSNIAAIKWNGNLEQNYDEDLKSNVNLFRVLFSVLSKNPEYLKSLEDDSSYNLKLNSYGFKSVEKMIDTNGKINIEE